MSDGVYRHVPLEFTRLEPLEQMRCAREFRRQLATRRSVRQFSPDPVPRELIEELLQIAGNAPSGANLQPWRFVAVSDPTIKREIRLAAEEEERVSYEHRMPEEWLTALAPLGTDWHKEFLETVPWIIVVFRQDHGVASDGSKIKHYYAQESVGIATGFLIAAIHAAGLATLTHTPSPMGFLARILRRPANERPFLMLPVGYPAPGATAPAITKKSLDEIAVWM